MAEVFALNDYGSTPFATAGAPNRPRGPGGLLSQADAGNQLQLEDATMRAQFNKTGSSSYHVRFSTPVVHDPITIVVPGNNGPLLQSGRGVIFPSVNIQWWATQIQNLNASLGYVDPTHLQIYLTDNVMLHSGNDPFNCCVFGLHGAGRGTILHEQRTAKWQRQPACSDPHFEALVEKMFAPTKTLECAIIFAIFSPTSNGATFTRLPSRRSCRLAAH